MFGKLFKNKEKKIKPVYVGVKILDGLPLSEDAKVQLGHDDSQIIIQELIHDGTKCKVLNTFRINLENVLDIIVSNEKEIITKSKSVVGRGLVGGVVFGPAGLLLGGLSGIGQKEKVKDNILLVIAYKDKSGDIANIIFKVNQASKNGAKKFEENIKLLIGIDNEMIETNPIGNDIEL